MGNAITIFRKELKDQLRDRRTILMMLVVPLVLIPVLMTVLVKVGQQQERKAEAKTIQVALIGREYAPELVAVLERDSQVQIREGVSLDTIPGLIRADSLDGALVIPEDFGELIETDRRGNVSVYFRSASSLNVAQRRINDAVNEYDEMVVQRRIESRGLDEALFDAVEITPVDISSTQELIGKLAGGFLPYMFIIFCFMGSMYPGIDLGAGEKERGTLETLLSSPASRMEVVLGKFLVVGLIGLTSALVAMVGMWFAFQQIGDMPPEMTEAISDILSLKIVVLIVTLLIPIEAFFAGTILALSIYAKSFKEAQSIITPLNIAVIIPAAIALMPGMELDFTTSLIPILNVSLATKDVIAGTINPVYLGLTYASLLVLAAGAIFFCVTWFKRESVLFRA